MNRILVLAGIVACFGIGKASAQSDRYQVGGMQVTALGGAYQFRDPKTQNLLHGYVEQEPGMAPPKKTDIVEFHICNTSEKPLRIEFQKLKSGPPCRTFWHGPWQAWTLENRKLVASGPQGNMTVIDLGALPSNLQSSLQGSKSGEVRAFSFPSPSGMTTLGVITNPSAATTVR